MYITQRGRKYWAFHDVPPSLSGAQGLPKKRFSANLDTSDYEIAKIRAADLEAQWRTMLKQVKTGVPLNDDDVFNRHLYTIADVERMVSAIKDDYRQATSPAERQKLLKTAAILADDAAYDIDGVPHSHDEPNDPADEREGVKASGRILDAAAGHLTGFTDYLDEYLDTLNIGEKTVSERRSRIKEFASEFPYIADVQRKDVQKWVNAFAKRGGRTGNGTALATIRRALGDIRGYWKYLQSISAAREDNNPFEKLSLPKNSKDKKGDDRLPFTPDDVLKLLASAHGDEQLVDVITFGMWTGARIEEFCSLKIKDVNLEQQCFEITNTKTSAGWRQVPIHSQLMPVMRRLIEASNSDYVFSGLSMSNFGKRSGPVGKRFGRLKKALGFGPRHVFHSIRKTVATILENVGVPEGVAADILGHEKQTITYGLYSGGTSLEKKREAIEKLSYKTA